MAGGRHKPIARLRGFLLLLLVMITGALVALYLFGRAGKPGVAVEEERDGVASPEGEITLIGEGFEFTHSEEERPLFRVRGDSIRADRKGTVYLDGVGLTLYDEDGTGYEVAAERASYNRERRQARLAGEVVLSGPDNSQLATRGLRMVEDGNVLLSTGPVRFRWMDLTGTARRLRIDRSQDVYQLTGDVRVESLPGAEEEVLLTAERLFFERGSHQVQAANDVVLVRGGDRVEAGRVNAFLDDDNSQVIFLRARLDVSGNLALSTAQARDRGTGDAAAGVQRRLRFTGRSLSLLRDERGRLRNAEIEGAPRQPVVAETPSPDGTLQRLVAGYLVGEFGNGILTQVRAFNEPRLEELNRPGGEVTRNLKGRRLEASFAADGRMVALAAQEDVTFSDDQIRARGDRATFDTLEETGSFFGAPARLESARGELLAPRVDYERKTSFIHARDGVRAVAREAEDLGLGGTPLGAGGADAGPVRVESTEAFWRDDPRSAMFRGEVRAWRGENLLLADAVRADQGAGEQKLTASGSVRTVWLPAAEGAAVVAAADGGPASAQAPVEVTANTLTYQQPSDILIYEGQVRAEQGRQTLHCQRLEVELNDDGQAETLICVGDARLDDRAGGNSARGQRAVYDLTSRKVTMTGDPVTLKKSDGAQVQGGRVIYDLETGTAEVRGQAAAPSTAAPPSSTPSTPAAAPATTGGADGAQG